MTTIKSLKPNFRNIVLVIIDAILINLAVYSALLFRFDAHIPVKYIDAFITLSPIFTFLGLAFLMGLNLYSRIWEYASIGEMIAILRATTASIGSAIVIIYTFELQGLPRSVYVGTWVMMNALIGASRISWRLFKDRCLIHTEKQARRILIVGAGDAGAILAREIQSNTKLNMKVVGFVDDDRAKRRQFLYGVPVLGDRSRIPVLVRNLAVEEVIIAIPSAPGSVVRCILEICKGTNSRVRILPGIYQSIKGRMVTNLRNVQMDDLLYREPIETDLNEIAGYIGDKTILITGAGGSIGSELCRQVLSLGPAKLVMVDNCENNLFDIETEMHTMKAVTEICPELKDVKHKDKMERIFKKYSPNVVFHAAAYKHVPMMERHPDEAIGNNVIGTRNVAELADKYKVDTFILVSTDKAVNPTSVMGASKCLAELIVKDIGRNSKTKFAAVRFGNVLGSRGSVIPTFIKQIESGGPLTVTHPEMRRYFMTIPEAVQLIIQAGAMAENGEIFVLDMGDMVKIDDLARDLIYLSGRELGRDLEIIYTGIRPGEKLYEELFTDREGMGATKHERIFISQQEMDADYINVGKTIMSVYNNGFANSGAVIDLIKRLIPEYRGQEHKVG
ncbi:MAG: polysaccharide biosynthesis protein [Syntrophomonadaceae bacterium]|jgi:FlaA1/EpsC-like NDP-sugar epimerase